MSVTFTNAGAAIRINDTIRGVQTSIEKSGIIIRVDNATTFHVRHSDGFIQHYEYATVAAPSSTSLSNLFHLLTVMVNTSSARTFTVQSPITTVVNPSSSLPLLSLRVDPANTTSSVTSISLRASNVQSGSIARIDVYKDSTLTGDNFASVNADSVAQVDVSATAASGGSLVNTLYMYDTSVESVDIKSGSVTGNTTLTFVVTNVAGTLETQCAVTFDEFD